MKQLIFFFSIICLLVQASVEAARYGELDQWLNEQSHLSFNRLRENISPPGTAPGVVVASPSKSNPDYFYHWVRDAGLVLDVIVNRYKAATDSGLKGHLEGTVWNFVDFSIRNQSTPNPSGGAGEPKFHVDGSAYLGSWGRPQNDGPAIRATTLIHFANNLLSQGKETLVRERLYHSGHSVIKFDLEYVSHNWRNRGFDLWEEVYGHHFYTQMVQRRALIEGGRLAQRLGDTGASQWYFSQAKELEYQLSRYWDPGKGVFVPTIEGGGKDKHSGLDSAIVLALHHGSLNDGFIPYTDDRVLSTVAHQEKEFFQKYPINRDGNPGIAIGRYPEDRYDGYSSNGEGNPWVLCTAAFAEFYYRLARNLEQQGKLRFTPLNIPFFRALGVQPKAGQTFVRGDRIFDQILESTIEKGDHFLLRIRRHADVGGRLAEQINRHSGFMQGARDLTWSYASLITAIEHRRKW